MEELLLDIIEAVRAGGVLSEKALDKIVRSHNRGLAKGSRALSKKRIFPYYLRMKRQDPAHWESWRVDEALERRLAQSLRMKPRRSASGVATISVLTKPWPCEGRCVYCPNDLRMPKSYLADEPACQRAERCCFDPYLQVWSRVRALTQMGHPLDKVELIVLGGTWNDYPEGYRIWFAEELFRALNDGDAAEGEARKRRRLYRSEGISCDPDERAKSCASLQARVNRGELSYNEALPKLYASSWDAIGATQHATLEELAAQQRRNEGAHRRVVGLVVETRPDSIDCQNLWLLRRIGCTKVQIGVQSIDDRLLAANGRKSDCATTERALFLLRRFGFKIHAHWMFNLVGASPQSDIDDYARFANDPRFSPDEVKLYPCVLVPGARLEKLWKSGDWQPYSREELHDVLSSATLSTPPFARVSRMIRDIPQADIEAGNTCTNLRQLVEGRMAEEGRCTSIREIRYREIGRADVSADDLRLEECAYSCVGSEERFLQWVDDAGRIAGFLRLSLPVPSSFPADSSKGLLSPLLPGEAMIREVHIYGRAERLDIGGGEGDAAVGGAAHPRGEGDAAVEGAAHPTGGEGGVQHRGLGRALIERACAIARDAGYRRIKVISAVGTRPYYRLLGFRDDEPGEDEEALDGEMIDGELLDDGSGPVSGPFNARGLYQWRDLA